METFFSPTSVAVVGASNSPFNLGGTICHTLFNQKGFNGKAYAVNVRGEDVHGCDGFTSVKDIPDDVDLAIIIVAAKHVSGVMSNCAEKGVKHVIIESAGFSEEGEAGIAMQNEIDSIARENGIRIMGPNCLGVISTESRFCCFYGINDEMMDTLDQMYEEPGTISYVIQSGGVGVLILESIIRDVVNLNKMVSIGNKSDVDEGDLIDYFQNDGSEVIGMYLENVKNGRKLMDAARRSDKPVLIFKVGRTEAGAGAALSHTAGMANDDIIFESACRQSGIIRLKSVTELHSMPKIFTTMPPLKGKNIAVFTNSGAFGGISADLIIEGGLKMAELSEDTQEKLKKFGTIYNASNPIDLGPALSPQTYLDIYEVLLQADEVDGLLPAPSMWRGWVIETLAELPAMCKKYGKPAAIYTPNATAKIIEMREKYSVPMFESPEEAARALSMSYTYNQWKEKRISREEVIYNNSRSGLVCI